MLRTTTLSVYIIAFAFPLLSACTSATSVRTTTLERWKPAIKLSITPTEPSAIAATAREMTQLPSRGQDCQPASKSVDIAPQYYGRAVGTSPVWAIINRRELVFSMDELRENPLNAHGYQYKVLWVIEKTFSGKVVLQGGNLENGTPLWFKFGGDEPTTTPTIDPLNPGAFSNSDYFDFPSYLYIPGAGCYFLEADWEEGSWRISLNVTE